MTVGPAGDLSQLADEELVVRMVRGDANALETLYDRHAGALFIYACRLREDRAAAGKLLHDAFLRLWRSPSSHSPARGSVRTWLLTLLGSVAIGLPPGSERVG